MQCFGLKFFRLFQWNESFKRNLREYNFGILWKVLLKQNGKFESVPSCCIPLETLENAEILTAKVFAENKSGEELIDAFSKNFASQCGFCTSGFAISLSKKTETSGSKILDGNFCRCTGYRPILQDRNSKEINYINHLIVDSQFHTSLKHISSTQKGHSFQPP